jgi:hypothetical protein
VKGQSNSVIAGSPRNAFRCSVACFLPEVEHWIADGPDQVTDVSQTPNAGKSERSSETAGDKLRSREGNSPDHQLRPLSGD